MSYQGKQTTIAGTFIKSQTITPLPDAKFNIAHVLLVSNDTPTIANETGLYGWFNSLDDIAVYFGVNTKTYKICKHFFQQTGNNNPALNKAFILIKTVNFTDATCATITTKGLSSRLSNFVPPVGSKSFVGKASFISGKDTQTIGKIELFKEPTIEKLAQALNRMSGQAFFEVVEVEGLKELKISTLFAGSQGQLVFSAVSGDLLQRGAVDIAGEDYLDLLGSNFVQVDGTDFKNNEEDNTTYFSNIIYNLSKNYGYNPRTILTSAVLSVDDVIAINNELSLLYQDINKNMNCKFITALSGTDEDKEYTQAFNQQPLFTMTINANYTKLSSLYLSSAICAPFVSTDVFASLRNDPEWGGLVLDQEVYENQKGFDNAESNNIADSGYSVIVQFNGEGLGLVVRGSNNGWSVEMHSAYTQIVNNVPILINNYIRSIQSKKKSNENISKLLAYLKGVGKALFNNDFLTNTPLEGDALFNSLSKDRQQDILEIGWSAYIKLVSQIEGNEIPYDIAFFLGGIMASFNGVFKVSKN